MKLLDSEKREIIKHLEADKELPDKYRFLLFDDKREVELVWNGKTNDVCNVVLPFQIIEQVDEPRAERPEDSDPNLNLFDNRGRQQKGWTNKLIWGDNKLILSSLKNGPLREEIEKQGGIKLIYIDPPFDVGADFSMDIEIGSDTFTKKPNILEEIAYRDTWGKGSDSFVAMLYERLVLIRDLLSSDGFVVIHMGDKVSALVKLVADEIFSSANYRNTIIISRGIKNVQSQFKDIRCLSVGHDVLLLFSKNKTARVEKLSLPGTETAHGKWDTFWRGTNRPTMRYELLGITPNSGQWRWKKERAVQAKSNYEFFLAQHGSDQPIDDYYFNNLENGNDLDFIRLGPNKTVQYFVPPRDYKLASTLWTSVRTRGSATGYATEKNEELLSVVVDWLSKDGELIADFFCGSGTTLAVAEKLGRKWIGSDLGKFAIHTTRKRMIAVQRQLKKDGKDFRAFEIMNLGKYERQHFIGINPNLRDKDKELQRQKKEKDFVDLIISAYSAEPTEGLNCFHAKKSGRMVAIGPVNLPVTRLFVEEIILECRSKRISRVDILAFEYEMGLFPNIQEEAKTKGIDLALKYIPPDVFDKRAVAKKQVAFHDVSYIEIKPHVSKKGIAIELTDFSVYYSQDSSDDTISKLKNNQSKVVVETGQVVKISKDKNGIVSRDRLTKHWTDWIDYWSVDFNFEHKREIIRVKDEITGDFKEHWTGDFVFENEWQSFKTKKDRSLELKTPVHECAPGRYKIAVKVVDIFGNDTMKIIPVSVGGK